MTEIYNNTQYQIMSVFSMLQNAEFDPETAAKVDNVTIQTKDDPDGDYSSDDVIMLRGDNNNVQASGGDNQIFLAGVNNLAQSAAGKDEIYLLGDNNVAISGDGNDTVYVEGDNNAVVDSKGNNKMVVLGNSNSIVAGNGNNKVAVLGNNSSISLGDGNQYVAYWGDDNTILAGDGNSTFATLDYAMKQNQFKELEDVWVDTLNVTHEYSREILETTVDEDVFDELSDRDKVSVETLDLTQQISENIPKYVVALDADGQPRLYVYSETKYDDYVYKPVNNYSEDKNEVSINSTEIYDYCKTGTISGNEIQKDTYHVSGVSGNTIIAGDGNNTVLHTVADNTNSITLGEGNKRIEQEIEYTFDNIITNPFSKAYSTYKYSVAIAQDE